MSTQFFEQVFLVNNIPAISGIFEAQDIIKRYVFTGDYYMNKAKEFAEKFKNVNNAIRRAYSRKNPISYYMYINYNEDPEFIGIHQQEWTFGFDSLNNTGSEFYDETEETLQLTSSNCYICGEYLQGYSLEVHNIPYCNCQHNNELPELEEYQILPPHDFEVPFQNISLEQEYQQFWQDYWYQYEVDLNNIIINDIDNNIVNDIDNEYHDEDFYNINGYE